MLQMQHQMLGGKSRALHLSTYSLVFTDRQLHLRYSKFCAGQSLQLGCFLAIRKYSTQLLMQLERYFKGHTGQPFAVICSSTTHDRIQFPVHKPAYHCPTSTPFNVILLQQPLCRLSPSSILFFTTTLILQVWPSSAFHAVHDPGRHLLLFFLSKPMDFLQFNTLLFPLLFLLQFRARLLSVPSHLLCLL